MILIETPVNILERKRDVFIKSIADGVGLSEAAQEYLFTYDIVKSADLLYSPLQYEHNLLRIAKQEFDPLNQATRIGGTDAARLAAGLSAQQEQFYEPSGYMHNEILPMPFKQGEMSNVEGEYGFNSSELWSNPELNPLIKPINDPTYGKINGMIQSVLTGTLPHPNLPIDPETGKNYTPDKLDHLRMIALHKKHGSNNMFFNSRFGVGRNYDEFSSPYKRYESHFKNWQNSKNITEDNEDVREEHRKFLANSLMNAKSMPYGDKEHSAALTPLHYLMGLEYEHPVIRNEILSELHSKRHASPLAIDHTAPLVKGFGDMGGTMSRQRLMLNFRKRGSKLFEFMNRPELISHHNIKGYAEHIPVNTKVNPNYVHDSIGPENYKGLRNHALSLMYPNEFPLYQELREELDKAYLDNDTEKIETLYSRVLPLESKFGRMDMPKYVRREGKFVSERLPSGRAKSEFSKSNLTREAFHLLMNVNPKTGLPFKDGENPAFSEFNRELPITERELKIALKRIDDSQQKIHGHKKARKIELPFINRHVHIDEDNEDYMMGVDKGIGFHHAEIFDNIPGLGLHHSAFIHALHDATFSKEDSEEVNKATGKDGIKSSLFGDSFETFHPTNEDRPANLFQPHFGIENFLGPMSLPTREVSARLVSVDSEGNPVDNLYVYEQDPTTNVKIKKKNPDIVGQKILRHRRPRRIDLTKKPSKPSKNSYGEEVQDDGHGISASSIYSAAHGWYLGGGVEGGKLGLHPLMSHSVHPEGANKKIQQFVDSTKRQFPRDDEGQVLSSHTQNNVAQSIHGRSPDTLPIHNNHHKVGIEGTGTDRKQREVFHKEGELLTMASMIGAANAPGNPQQESVLDLTNTNNLARTLDPRYIQHYLTQTTASPRLSQEDEIYLKEQIDGLRFHHNRNKVQIENKQRQLQSSKQMRNQMAEEDPSYFRTEKGREIEDKINRLDSELEELDKKQNDIIEEHQDKLKAYQKGTEGIPRDEMSRHFAERKLMDILGEDYLIPEQDTPYRLSNKGKVRNLQTKLNADITVLNEIAGDYAKRMGLSPEVFGDGDSETTLGNMHAFLRFIQERAGDLEEGHNYHSLFPAEEIEREPTRISNKERQGLKNLIEGNGTVVDLENQDSLKNFAKKVTPISGGVGSQDMYKRKINELALKIQLEVKRKTKNRELDEPHHEGKNPKFSVMTQQELLDMMNNNPEGKEYSRKDVREMFSHRGNPLDIGISKLSLPGYQEFYMSEHHVPIADYFVDTNLKRKRNFTMQRLGNHGKSDGRNVYNLLAKRNKNIAKWPLKTDMEFYMDENNQPRARMIDPVEKKYNSVPSTFYDTLIPHFNRGSHWENIMADKMSGVAKAPILLASLTNPDIIIKEEATNVPILQPMHRIFELDNLENLKGFSGDWIVTSFPKGQRMFVEKKDDDITVKGEHKLSKEDEKNFVKVSDKDYVLDVLYDGKEYHIIDVTKYDDKESVHTLPVHERMKILRGTMESHENVLVPAAHNLRLTDDAGLEKTIESLQEDHKRLLLRDADSTYMKGEMRHPKWVVLEEGHDVNLIVLDRRGRSPYTYRLGVGPITHNEKLGDRAVEHENETYMDVGTAFHSESKYDIGDIVRVNAGHVSTKQGEDDQTIYTLQGNKIEEEASGEGVSSVETLSMLAKSELTVLPHDVYRKGERVVVKMDAGSVSYRASEVGDKWILHNPRADNNWLIRLSESHRDYWSPVAGVMLKADLNIEEEETKAEVHESKNDGKPLIKPKKVKNTDFWETEKVRRLLAKSLGLVESLVKSTMAGSVGYHNNAGKGLAIDYATPIESPMGPTNLNDEKTMPDFDNRKREGEDSYIEPKQEEEKGTGKHIRLDDEAALYLDDDNARIVSL